MHPLTVEVVCCADKLIAWNKRFIFHIWWLRFANAGFLPINVLNWWAQDYPWYYWFLFLMSAWAVYSCSRTIRTLRKSLKFHEEIRRNFMLFDAAPTLSAAQCYMDQIDAAFAKN